MKESFEALLLKKIGSTKPKIATRRLIHARAAVITSDEYTKKIEDLEKQSRSKKPRKPRKKSSTASKSRAAKDSTPTPDKENVSPDADCSADQVAENDYALSSQTNGETIVCFVEKVMPNLEKAVALRLVNVDSESRSNALKVDGPCILSISNVIKNAGKPVTVPTSEGVQYIFEVL